MTRAMLFAAGVLVGAATLPTQAQAEPRLDPARIDAELGPHGSWLTLEPFGRVWSPSAVEADWRPYSAGEWAYRSGDWTWRSSFAWGDIPFHYGRWLEDQSEGWVWVPGYDYAPAWVLWDSEDDVVTWAPMPPTAGDVVATLLPESWMYAPADRFRTDRVTVRDGQVVAVAATTAAVSVRPPSRTIVVSSPYYDPWIAPRHRWYVRNPNPFYWHPGYRASVHAYHRSRTRAAVRANNRAAARARARSAARVRNRAYNRAAARSAARSRGRSEARRAAPARGRSEARSAGRAGRRSKARSSARSRSRSEARSSRGASAGRSSGRSRDRSSAGRSSGRSGGRSSAGRSSGRSRGRSSAGRGGRSGRGGHRAR